MEWLKTKLKWVIYTILGVGVVYAAGSGVVDQPVLKSDIDKVIATETRGNVLHYTYKTNQVVPYEKNEVVSKRTNRTKTIDLGGGKFVAKSGYSQIKEDGQWIKIDRATTTTEIYEEEKTKAEQAKLSLIDKIYAATTGSTIGGTASDEGGGTATDGSWANVSNILIDSDATFASNNALVDDGQFSNFLHSTNYGFSLGGSDTIDGIILVTRVDVDNSDSAEDQVIQLVKGGTRQGNNKASIIDWPTTFGSRTYGSSTDLWGLSWTASDINSSTFGSALQYECTERSGCEAAAQKVASMKIEVYYTEVVADLFDGDWESKGTTESKGTIEVK